MTSSFGATPLYSEAYTRDALGRIVTRVETIQGTTTTWEYGYDAAGRLETVTKDGLVASQYAYDANGNRLVKQTPTVYETGTYDAQDRMLTYAGASYTYTANGETLTKTDATGTTSYQYDVFGNLLGVDLPSGTQVRYKVDGRNRRIERSVNGVVTQRWLWQGQRSPIAELNAANAVVSRFVYATRVNVPDYMVRGGATYRILHDHLGSPRLVVNTSTGAIAQRMDFDEWGIVTTDTNPGWQPFGFAGGVLDSVNDTVRFGAREFAPDAGRWGSRDPSKFAGSPANLYRYVGNDGVNFIDPSGEELTPAQVVNIIFNETRSLSGPDIFDARKNIAHAIRNGDELFGQSRPLTAPDAATVLPGEQEIYDQCIAAVISADFERELGWDPTDGAYHFNFRSNDSTSPFFGQSLRTQDGPFDNSYPTQVLPATGIYANTYGPPN
jgi:RHS repeat-associated protein